MGKGIKFTFADDDESEESESKEKKKLEENDVFTHNMNVHQTKTKDMNLEEKVASNKDKISSEFSISEHKIMSISDYKDKFPKGSHKIKFLILISDFKWTGMHNEHF